MGQLVVDMMTIRWLIAPLYQRDVWDKASPSNEAKHLGQQTASHQALLPPGNITLKVRRIRVKVSPLRRKRP